MTVETETPPKTETEATEPEVRAERPAWLPPNFENPEALAARYRAAQQKITEMGQDNRALRDENEQLTVELEGLLEARHMMEDRVAVLERGLLQRLVGRRPGA